jgi:hypothetical protein
MPKKRTRRDPVADKNALIRFLRDHPKQPFAAGDLRIRTGVPKNHVRGHLSGESNVAVEETSRKTFYRFKLSSRKR